MIKIYGRTTAFNVQKILWFIEELELEYSHIELGGDFGGLDTKEFLDMNINGTIPVLDDCGSYIWESHTILRYLATQFSPEIWSNHSPLERSNYERWMDWGHTTFQPLFMKLFWGYYRTPAHLVNRKLIDENTIVMNKLLKRLDIVLRDKNFLTGSNISLGDICVGSSLYRLVNIGLDITLPPMVERWYNTLKNRDGYKKWIMSDFSSLKDKISY